MRGTVGEPYGDEGGETLSRRLTPTADLAAVRDPHGQVSNEDFLFHLYRGSELLQDNRAHEAKEELERALLLQPDDAKGQDLLAVVYFRLGLYPRAIAIYEQLRRTSPRDPSLLLNLALCYLKTGQPSLARRDLEALLAVNEGHARAWGYLGLACERLGDLAAAEHAFRQGGHGQMARRIEERRAATGGERGASVSPAGPRQARETREAREVREVIAAAYEELDAGELTFELAKPASDSRESTAGAWSPVELGVVQGDRMPMARSGSPRYEESDEAISSKPDTRDGPPDAHAPVSVPQMRSPSPGKRRQTILLGVAPTSDHQGEIEALSRVPSPKPPPVSSRDAVALRSLAPAPVPTITPSLGHGTLPPPPATSGTAPPPAVAELTRGSAAAFSSEDRVVVHLSGVALVRTTTAGFAARIEAIRASSSGLAMKVLDRHVLGKPTGEAFGGAASPVALVSGDGQLVLGPRAGRRLSSFLMEEDMCFVREEVLLGFDGDLAFENGRLAAGDGEAFSIVQMRGSGAVLLEATSDPLTLEVHGGRGLSVRRDSVLGWFGRLVPRALPSNEAPCGQRGLVSFAGEGRVLITGT